MTHGFAAAGAFAADAGGSVFVVVPAAAGGAGLVAGACWPITTAAVTNVPAIKTGNLWLMRNLLISVFIGVAPYGISRRSVLPSIPHICIPGVQCSFPFDDRAASKS